MLLVKAIIFTLTGVLSTIVAQVLIYAGAGESWTMLLPFSNYFGMFLAAFVPDAWIGGVGGGKGSSGNPSSSSSSSSLGGGGQQDDDKHPNHYSGSSLAPLLRFLDVPRGGGGPHMRSSLPPGTLTVNLPVYVCFAVVMDIVGFYLHVQGIKYAGSALFQVLYCSVVVWSALMYWATRTPLGSRVLMSLGLVEFLTPPGPGGEVAPGDPLNSTQMAGIAMVLGGLGVTALAEHSNSSSSAGGHTGGGHGAAAAGGSVGALGVVYGLACSVGCAVAYGMVYTLAELLMSHPSPPRAQAVSARVGGGICCVLGAYILVGVLPRWGEVVGGIGAKGLLTPSSVALGYGIMLLSAVAHSITYFQIMGQAGAVTTGIMQAARAVGVFVFSALLFCAHTAVAGGVAGGSSGSGSGGAGSMTWDSIKHESQCFSVFRGISTVMVCGGILVYSYGKSTSKGGAGRKESESSEEEGVPGG